MFVVVVVAVDDYAILHPESKQGTSGDAVGATKVEYITNTFVFRIHCCVILPLFLRFSLFFACQLKNSILFTTLALGF